MVNTAYTNFTNGISVLNPSDPDGTAYFIADSSGVTVNGSVIAPAEIAFLDGVVAGTATASKAVVLGAAKEIATITTATITNVDIGASGSAGTLDIFPSTASKGKIAIAATANTNNDTTTITNAAQGGAYTYTIPDAGASAAFVMTAGAQTVGGAKTLSSALTVNPTTNQLVLGVTNTTTINSTAPSASRVYTIPDAGGAANFLLSEGAQTVNGAQTFGSTVAVTGALTSTTAKTDYQQFVGIESVLAASAGTWTITRVAQGNYVYRHTAADNTTILGIDLSPIIRTTASKGFRLDSIDVVYSIGTDALEAHTATLDLITYADNAAVTVTSAPLTGSLATATQANPYVTNLAVTTPAFDVTGDTKYVFELTVNAAATSAYDYYGLMLKFSRNDL